MAACPVTAAGGSVQCSPVDVPRLPDYGLGTKIAVVIDEVKSQHPFRAAVLGHGKIHLHELKMKGLEKDWEATKELMIPEHSLKPVSLSGDHSRIIMAMDDGSIFHWMFLSFALDVLHDQQE